VLDYADGWVVMGAAKPTLGYPSRTAAVLALRAQRLPTDAIARRIGISPKTVVALECSADRSRQLVADGNQTILFSGELLEDLRPHAARRGISVRQLARLIVETAVDHDLIDALLDDEATRCK
jgi:hypothetical protein